MAGGPISSNFSTLEGGSNKNYALPIALMSGLFFIIGFVTVLNDVLIPIMQDIFHFSAHENWKLLLIQFSFFVAYGIISIPGGHLVKKIGYKKGTIYSLLLVALGLLLFYPASIMASYGLFLMALFIVGGGFAILQVAINPYLIALGTPETGASRLNLGGALNSTATAIGPIFGTYMLLNECISKAEDKLGTVRSLYLVLAVIIIVMVILLIYSKLPKLSIENDKDEQLEGDIFQFRHLVFGALAIFFYVGAEVVIGSLLVVYLKSPTMGHIPERIAGTLVAYYWGGAMIGRFLGSAITKKIAPNLALSFVAAASFVLIFLSMTDIMIDNKISIPYINIGDNCDTNSFYLNFKTITLPWAAVCLLSIGFFNAIMWPSIFTLGIARLGKYTSKGSGIMVTMVAGGAFVSILQGFLADQIGYTYSFSICLVCYIYILFFGLNGYKPIKVADNEKGEIVEI